MASPGQPFGRANSVSEQHHHAAPACTPSRARGGADIEQREGAAHPGRAQGHDAAKHSDGQWIIEQESKRPNWFSDRWKVKMPTRNLRLECSRAPRLEQESAQWQRKFRLVKEPREAEGFAREASNAAAGSAAEKENGPVCSTVPQQKPLVESVSPLTPGCGNHAEQKRAVAAGEPTGRRGEAEADASPGHTHSCCLSAADTARGDHESNKVTSPEEHCEDWVRPQVRLVDKFDQAFAAVRGPPTTDMHEELIKTPRLARLASGMRDQFRIIRKLGQGGFANVYEAWDKVSQRYVALKVFNPCQDHLSCRTEAMHLRTYGGEKHNIIFMVDCPPIAPRGGFLASGDVQVLCLPFFEHDEPHTFIPEGLETHECRTYLKGLFVALARLHEDGVLHRDIKPGNYLYNRKEGRCLLIDFGLAEQRSRGDSVRLRRPSQTSPVTEAPAGAGSKRRRVGEMPEGMKERSRQSHVLPSAGHMKLAGIMGGSDGTNGWQPAGGGASRKTVQGGAATGKRKEPRANQAGTKGWRAPEVLMQSQQQTTAIDIWSVGVVMLSLLSRKYPYFDCADNPTNLLQIRHMRMHVASMDLVRDGTGRVVDKMRAVGRDLNLQVSMGDMIDSFEEGVRAWKYTWKSFLEGQCRACPKSGCKHLDEMGLDEGHPIWDLLDRCLDLDPRTRMTAKEALAHPFFASAES